MNRLFAPFSTPMRFMYSTCSRDQLLMRRLILEHRRRGRRSVLAGERLAQRAPNKVADLLARDGFVPARMMSRTHRVTPSAKA